MRNVPTLIWKDRVCKEPVDLWLAHLIITKGDITRSKHRYCGNIAVGLYVQFWV